MNSHGLRELLEHGKILLIIKKLDLFDIGQGKVLP